MTLLDRADGRTGVISGARVLRDLEALSAFGAAAVGPGVTRPAFSPQMRQAQDWLLGRMTSAGMTARLDGVGNVIGRIGPADAPAVVIGSHIDTVPCGGRLDGALGVVAGLEVARVLRDLGTPLHKAVEVIAFCDEEGAWLSLLGSRAMAGDLSREEIVAACGRDGTPLETALAGAGLSVDSVLGAARPPEELCAFLELHIEQGPVLDTAGQSLGAVTGIAGLLSGELTFNGRAAHAGTTPMALRQDAFRVAAEAMAVAFEAVERDFPEEARLTFGTVQATPGATNVVPSRVVLGYDIRALDAGMISRLRDRVAEVAARICERSGVTVRDRELCYDPPAPMDDALRARLERACSQLGHPARRMPSGAGHDAQAMAGVCPAAMLFVPSRGGVSHHPDEATAEADIALGVEVLARVTMELVDEA